jgi:hypothetical protein
MRALRILGIAFGAPLIVVSLTSCIFAGALLEQAGPVNDRETVEGPPGWEEYPSCPTGPRDDFVWVEGLPNDAIDSAGIRADCGDTWIESDGDSFVGVADFTVTESQLDALRDGLIDAGWQMKWDDFAPVSSPAAERGAAGARDFYIDDDERLLAVEIYNNGTDPVSYTAYIDYHSPETRALR